MSLGFIAAFILSLVVAWFVFSPIFEDVASENNLANSNGDSKSEG